MGGCYSSENHRALSSPRHKRPKDKWHKYRVNGDHYYSSVRNGNSSHQADAAQVVGASCVPQPYNTETSLDSQLPGRDEKCVAPSDSGIESIGATHEDPPTPEPPVKAPFKHFTLCPSCQQKLQRLSISSCGKCGQVKVSSSELCALVKSETYCTCGPRQLGKQSQCRTHGGRGRQDSVSQRHSDIPASFLKPSLKKNGLEKGDGVSKHVRMSWKSANSLDMSTTAIMTNTCMDRAKSEQSEVFRDDISFRAPLAQFDSVDRHLENEEEQCDGAILASRMSIYSELLDLADSICRCDFATTVSDGTSTANHSAVQAARTTNDSNCTGNGEGGKPPSFDSLSRSLIYANEEDDEDSGNGMSKSEDRSASASDMDREVELEEETLSTGSSPYRRAAANTFGNLENGEDELSGPVSMMVMGRQMVMMDASMYSQMLIDLALLREQLGHLTQIIQEEDLELTVAPLNLNSTLQESDI